MLAGATEATRQMSPEIASAPPPPPARAAPPRRRPATPPAPARPVAAPAKRSGFSRLMRVVGVLLLIAILAAVIAGAVLLLTDAGQSTNIGELLEQELSDQVQSLKDFIRENTQ